MSTQEQEMADADDNLAISRAVSMSLPDLRRTVAAMPAAARLSLLNKMVWTAHCESSPGHRAEVLAVIAHLSHLLTAQQKVSAAMSLARTLHRGQVDKLSEPYWKHLHAVAEAIPEDQHLERQVAWLHDSLEDTGVGLDLVRALIGDEGASAVEAITHRPHEPRVDYYQRVLANPLAALVKRADVAHNSNPDRLAQLDEKTRVRLELKYAQALAILNELA